MKHKYFPILFCSIILFTASCGSSSRYYYSPDEGQLLSINQKGDFHVSNSVRNLSLKDSINHLNLQIGYSPIKHLAIQGSFFYVKDKDRRNPLITEKGHIWNGAIGGYYFFKPWEESPLRNIKKSSRIGNIRFESPVFFQKNYMKKGLSLDLYLGYANGLLNVDYGSRGMSFTKFQKLYSQLGFHWFNDLGGFSYTLKIGNLSFNQAKSSGLVDFRDLEKLQQLKNNNAFTIRENSFRLFTGIRQVNIFFNLTVLTAPSELNLIGVDHGNFSIGVLVDIDECFRRKRLE